MDFELYDLVWYWDNPEAIYNPCIDIWLSVYHWVGLELCYWILTDKGNVFYQTTVQPLIIYEMKDHGIAGKVKSYTDTLDGNLSDPEYIST